MIDDRDQRPILVTGPTGNVGREVVAILKERGVAFRLAARAEEPRSSAPGIAQARFDFLDAATYAPAVSGCTAVFLLRPPAISNTKTTLNRFIDVARSAGVEQIVFVSVAGAASNPLVPHHAVERHLRRGSGGWTILRPGFFAQNLESAYRDDIRRDDRLYVPAGSGRVAFVDTRDLAEVAVAALLDPATHRHRAYTLTGPKALSFDDVAALLSGELGRSIRYDRASMIGYLRHLIDAGLPIAQALVQAVLHVGLRFGQAEAVDPTLARLLGRSSRTMAAYIHDRRDQWLINAPETRSDAAVASAHA